MILYARQVVHQLIDSITTIGSTPDVYLFKWESIQIIEMHPEMNSIQLKSITESVWQLTICGPVFGLRLTSGNFWLAKGEREKQTVISINI